MTFDSKKQRKIMGQFATGVTVVTTGGEAGLHGLTANAVASLSLDPPLVLVAVDKRGAFAGSPLEESVLRGQYSPPRPGRHLAGLPRRGRGFSDLQTTTASTAAPILAGCIAYVDCRVVDILPGGDHSIFIGEIVAGEFHGGEPLLYHAGGYRRLAE